MIFSSKVDAEGRICMQRFSENLQAGILTYLSQITLLEQLCCPPNHRLKNAVAFAGSWLDLSGLGRGEIWGTAAGQKCTAALRKLEAGFMWTLSSALWTGLSCF